jgi:glyoxylase-like metal-dependent hydrolase (beta-lactamase superfamily II)
LRSRGRRPWIDPWLVRHLLLSVEDRDRSPRDRAELALAVARCVDALGSLPAPAPFLPPVPVGPAGSLFGVPEWIFETNAWVLAPGGRGGPCVIFDVPPRPHALVAELRRHRLRPAGVFLTHGHLDHVGGVAEFLEAVGALGPDPVPVHVHPDDVAHVLEPSGVDAVLARAAGTCPPLPNMLTTLVDGERTGIGEVVVEAVHLPGHTPGTTCYRVDLDGGPSLLFSGDQLFASGMGRTDLPGGCHPLMMESMRAYVDLLPDETVVLPGHGPATTMGAARPGNPFLGTGTEARTGGERSTAIRPQWGRKSRSSRFTSSGASSCIQWPGPSMRS